MTWPRVRLVFALIGMLATLSFLGLQLISAAEWIISILEEGKEMLP